MLAQSDKFGTSIGESLRVFSEDLRHKRRVAVKVLRPELAALIGAERFPAEIRTTANLQHPHILPLFDSGEVGGLLLRDDPRLVRIVTEMGLQP